MVSETRGWERAKFSKFIDYVDNTIIEESARMDEYHKFLQVFSFSRNAFRKSSWMISKLFYLTEWKQNFHLAEYAEL